MKDLSNAKEVRTTTKEQFEPLVHTYSDTVYRIAYQALKNRADAEDVMQTVLFKLFETDTVFETKEHIRAWLIHVTVNESRKLLRTPWRKRILPLEEWRDEPVFDKPEQSALFSAVMDLPRKYRMTVYLFYYEDMTTDEIAKALSAKPSTVRTWLKRAREMLKSELTSEEKEV